MKRLWTGVPGASGRWTRAFACGLGAVLLVAALPARDDGAVISLSVVPTSGQAHVVIGVNGEVGVRDFVLHSPDRVVVDITGARLGVSRGGYDRIARGGVLDVRYAQNKPNVVRVVLTLAGPRHYDVLHTSGQIRISVDGGDKFEAWSHGQPRHVTAMAKAAAAAAAQPTPMTKPPAPVTPPPAKTKTSMTSESWPPHARETMATVSTPRTDSKNVVVASLQQQEPTPRITIAWENADIRDVLAQFAAFSGRTIIPARGVSGSITAEIIDQPWDIAMKAILNANGFDAVQFPSGIFIVNTIEALAQRPQMEALQTRTIRVNYTPPSTVAASVRPRLSRDCGTGTVQQPQQAAAAPAAPAAPTPIGQTPTPPAAPAQEPPPSFVVQRGPAQCVVRGAVTSDSLTGTVAITDVPGVLDDLVAYAQSLDVRQPQVNIKAKIILVDRTSLEALGLKYDLGSARQHFNDIVAREDTAGERETETIIALGGNAISAIANAATGVPNPTLRLIYSAAIGGFQFTTFLDAMQDVSLLDVQAEPSVTTLNLRPATLQAGTQVPIRTTEPGTGGNAAGAFPQVTVDLRQTGIVLQVTPSITKNRQIQMRVRAENSDVQFLGGDVGAVFPTQVIENELLVGDGETAVMGGLTQTSVRFAKTGIPFLVDLPLIGRLFGNTSRQETKRDLLILITPHIVDEGDMSMDARRSP